MWTRPKPGLDRKHEINALVSQPASLICNKASGNLCIIISASLMITQVQKQSNSDILLHWAAPKRNLNFLFFQWRMPEG